MRYRIKLFASWIPFLSALVYSASVGWLRRDNCLPLSFEIKSPDCLSVPLLADLGSLLVGTNSCIGAMLFIWLEKRWKELPSLCRDAGTLYRTTLWHPSNKKEKLASALIYGHAWRLTLLLIAVSLSWILYQIILSVGFIWKLDNAANPATLWWAYKELRPTLWIFFMSVGSIGFYFAIRTVFLLFLAASTIGRLADEGHFIVDGEFSKSIDGWTAITRYLDLSVIANLLGLLSIYGISLYVRGTEVISLAHYLVALLAVFVTPWIIYVYYVRWRGPLYRSFNSQKDILLHSIEKELVASRFESNYPGLTLVTLHSLSLRSTCQDCRRLRLLMTYWHLSDNVTFPSSRLLSLLLQGIGLIATALSFISGGITIVKLFVN